MLPTKNQPTYTIRPHSFDSIERIRTGAKAIIVHNGKILVLKEKVTRENQEKIIHDFPGGGIELGEVLTDALKREVFEEVGLTVEPVRVVGAWDYLVPTWDISQNNSDAKKSAIQIVCIGYECKVVGELSIDTTKNPADENIFETMWVTKEELLADSKMADNPAVV